MPERCRHEMLPGQCGHCDVQAKAPPPFAGPPPGLAWAAKYDGTCMECGGHIYPGDLIYKAPGGAGYLHAECAD